MITLDNNKLILSSEVVSMLNATPGDKITIEYLPYEESWIPIILKADRGNILTNSNTVSFKGSQYTYLHKYGDSFNVINNNGIFELHGNGSSIEDNIKEEKEIFTIDKSIILDTNYKINKFKTYEF